MRISGVILVGNSMGITQGKEEAKDKQDKPTVIYIVGVGHSGSTLLDLVLSTAPHTFSVGELKRLAFYAPFQGHSSQAGKWFTDDQGYPLKYSPFWGPIVAESPSYLVPSDKQRKLSLWDYVRILCTGSPSRAPKKYEYDTLLSLVHEQAEHVTDDRIDHIIDSSKTLSNLIDLNEHSSHDIFVVHAVRSLRGYVRSEWRRNRRVLRAAVHWIAANMLIRRYLTNVSHKTCVRYDSFIKDPESRIERLNTEIGLSIDPQSLTERINDQRSFRFAGNRMRLTFQGITRTKT